MANRRISGLTEYEAKPANDDLLYMVDVSDKTDSNAGSSRSFVARRLTFGDEDQLLF
jgi:hypothetical protein